MPPLSSSNVIRKETFIERILGGTFFRTKTGADIQNMMPSPLKRDPENLFSTGSGFVTELDDPRLMWLHEKLKVETDRLSTLTDIRIMTDGASYIDGPCGTFCNWATEGELNFTVDGNSKEKAKKIIGDLLDKIGYKKTRSDLIYNALFLELFIKQQIIPSDDFLELTRNPTIDNVLLAVKKGMKIGRMEKILTPAPETMFRNSDSQDDFPDPAKAFYQVPEPYNKNKSFIYTNAPDQWQEWFHSMFIIHPRIHYRRQKNQRYSRPILKAARSAFNKTELSTTDAVIQRHLTASRLLIFYLKANVRKDEDPGMDSDSVEKYAKEFIRKYPKGFNKAGTVLFESGSTKVESIGDLNITLSKPSDIYLHLELLFLGFLFPNQLLGYTGGEGAGTSGPLLDQLKKALEVNINVINSFEDAEIILPLIYMELALNGIFDVVVSVRHSTPSFDNKSVVVKKEMSEVEMGARSVRDYYEKNVMPETGKSWDEHWTQVQDEKKILSEINAKPINPDAKKEGINKGVSGSNKDSETVPISSNK